MDPMTGDILQSDAEALVNPVNCVGVMGKGLALEFKRAFPQNFESYRSACSDGLVRLGRVHVFATKTASLRYIIKTGRLMNPRYIVNFPTKHHWRDKSRISDIESGLCSLVDEVRCLGVMSIAIPPIGCGLGGLNWSVVRPMIEHMFSRLPEVRVVLYGPRT
jgi:O-acetyl-ADP-ribose deacetylase (regulator of RNase III)